MDLLIADMAMSPMRGVALGIKLCLCKHQVIELVASLGALMDVHAHAATM